ncbi:MAG: nicotinate-nucleotide adenylyltransferase [Pseudomonadota bacterium]
MTADATSALNPGLRIGVFGGTFNPVHVGHIQTVLEVKKALALDALFLVPAAVPPHKEKAHVAGARDRMAMLLLALSETPGVVVSDMELRRKGPSYSVDTIRDIRALLPPETELFFILGSDAFLEINTWHAYRALFEEISFIVMRRRTGTADPPENALKPLSELMATQVSPGYSYDPDLRAFRHPWMKTVYLFDNTERAVSATVIRERVRAGIAIDGLVPETVAAYIARKGLYQ